MAGEWRTGSLGDIVELKRGYDLPYQHRNEGNIPVISSSGPSGWHDQPMAKAPGVVTGRYGTIGEVFFVKEDFWPLNTTLYVRDFKGNDPRFISYFLRGIDYLACSDKAAVPGVNRNHLHKALISYPVDLEEQHAIAKILGSLDDKIELNRKMNETLEAIARALFKSWFIDFDPVRANAARRDTGFPPHIADIFPDSFQDSELGEIPKGWRVGSIYEIADVIYGAPFSSSKFSSLREGLPLVRIRDLATEDPEIFTTELLPKGRLLTPGDVVVGMDGEFRAHLWAGPRSWMNQRLCVFSPKNGVSAALVRLSIDSLLQKVEDSETATTVIHLGKSDIDRFRVIIPSNKLLEYFYSFSTPLYDRLIVSKQEGRHLEQIRDVLLPKLISGEVRVPQARGVLSEVL